MATSRFEVNESCSCGATVSVVQESQYGHTAEASVVAERFRKAHSQCRLTPPAQPEGSPS